MQLLLPSRRAWVPAVFAILFVLGHAGVASAKQDWLGWLEEFSGPGPFDGFEISAEVICYNISDTSVITRQSFNNVRVVTTVDALTALKKLLKSDDTAQLTAIAALISDISSLATVIQGRDNREYPKSLPFSVQAFPPAAQKDGVNDAEISSQIEALADRRPDDPTDIADARGALRDAWSKDVATLVAAGVRTSSNALGVIEVNRRTIQSKGSSKKKPWRTCIRAQADLERERARERAVAFRALADMARGVAPEQDVVTARTDHSLGVVVNVGKYRSLENRFYDPDQTSDSEPQLRVIPLEVLAHSKLSPAIDIGAGVGVAFFHLDGQPKTTKQVYFVPLSVVVRPAKLITYISSSRYASMVGYRMAVRRFRRLDGPDFGNPTSSFKVPGEFLWSSSLFVDVTAFFSKKQVEGFSR